LPAADLRWPRSVPPLAVQALQSPKQQRLIYCNVPGPGGLSSSDVIGATGDPLVDCAAFWKHALGTAAPALTAYQDTFGQIRVYPADASVPDGWRVLPGGVVQDREQILINEALSDSISGLRSRCFDRADAVAKTQAIVKASGFQDWPLMVDEASTTRYPAPNCWAAFVPPKTHQVSVAAGPTLADNVVPQVEQLAKPLRQSVTECWSMQTAVEKVRAAIAQSGFPLDAQRGFEIRQVPTPSVRCTTIHTGGGGNLEFTLRGPGR
jgi:hypothetical protein